MGNKKKMTVLDFQKYKDEGRKFSFVTAYDYTTASIVNESDCEIILVGDSLGMIMLGYNTTVPVTVDDMIHHIRRWSRALRTPSSSEICRLAPTTSARSRPLRRPTGSPRRPCATA